MVQMKDQYKMHLIENALLRFHLCKYQGPYAEPCSLACKQLILQWPRGSYSGLRDYLKLFQTTNSIQSTNQVKKKIYPKQEQINSLLKKKNTVGFYIINFPQGQLCLYVFIYFKKEFILAWGRNIPSKVHMAVCNFTHWQVSNILQNKSYLIFQFSSVQFSRSVVSDCLQPHDLQHARPPCPSPTPRVHSNSCPLSQ